MSERKTEPRADLVPSENTEMANKPDLEAPITTEAQFKAHCDRIHEELSQLEASIDSGLEALNTRFAIIEPVAESKVADWKQRLTDIKAEIHKLKANAISERDRDANEEEFKEEESLEEVIQRVVLQTLAAVGTDRGGPSNRQENERNHFDGRTL